MKTNSKIHPPLLKPVRRMVLGMALFLACGLIEMKAQAQTTVPLLVNYQGTVTDSTGTPLGNGAPVNRKILFRFWDATTAGTRLWTEEQTVTISQGQFSVLLGQGIDATGTAAGESRPALDTVFGGSGNDRYLGITVDNGDNTITVADTEITPRQRITSTAYSLRAKIADSVATASDLQLGGGANYGLGWYGTGRTFSGLAVNGPVLYGQSGGLLGAVNGATQTPVMRWNEFGQVGIGTTSLQGSGGTTRLTLQGNDTNIPPMQLTIRGDTDANKRLLIGYHTTTNYGAIQAYSAAATTTTLLLNQAGGNVGIGVSSAGMALEVNGAIGAAGASGHVFRAGGDTDGGLFSPGDGIVTLRTNGLEKVRLDADGDLGIGSANPLAMLDIAPPTASVNGIRLGKWADTASRFIGITDAFPVNFPTPNGFSGMELGGPSSAAEGFVAFHTHDNGVASAERMRIDKSGNVGIGTTAPVHKLDVNFPNGGVVGFGDIPGSGPLGYVGTNVTSPVANSTVEIISRNSHPITFNAYPGEVKTELLRIKSDGSVGIGTNNPTQARLVVSGTVTGNYTGNIGLLSTSGASVTSTSQSLGVSIYASGDVMAGTFRAISDERVKNVRSVSDSASDLKTLMDVRITDYSFKDTVARGGLVYKKVIAQQIEKVLPQAVSKTTDVVPDIFKEALFKDGWVQLTSDLKKGERVRLIDDKNQGIYEVLEVKKGQFRTGFQPAGGKLFVYGREVNDFRSVDYEAISMLNVSATQQIKKEKDAEIKTLKAQNAELTARLEALEAKDKAREAKLAAIEKLLLGNDKPTAQPVSLKREASGAE